MRQLICKGTALNAAYQTAADNLRTYVAKKNEHYKKDYMLQRWSEHGQDKLKFEYEQYKRAVRAHKTFVLEAVNRSSNY